MRHCLQTVAEGSSGRLQRPRAAAVNGGMRSVSEQRSNLLLLPPCPTSAETATPSPPPSPSLPPPPMPYQRGDGSADGGGDFSCRGFLGCIRRRGACCRGCSWGEAEQPGEL